MKTICILGILSLLSTLNAQTVNSPPGAGVTPAQYFIGEQAANHRTWMKVTTRPDGRGNTVTTTNVAYVELASGLNYWDATSNAWEPSSELIEQYPGGAIGQYGQTKVIFANNLNTSVAIDMQTPDGKRLQSHIVGLSYYDTASGQSVLIAQVKDCTGVIAGNNQVVYPDAFAGLKAAVIYKYTRTGLEQNVVLLQRPPLPETYGLNSDSTKLQVLTEFVSSPQPAVAADTITTTSGTVEDEFLDFGAMKIGRGRAFEMGAEQNRLPGVPVVKHWQLLNGRRILVEEVPIRAIAEDLDALPLTAQLNAAPTPNSTLYVIASGHLLPKPLLAKADKREMKMANLDMPSHGFVMDYQTLSGAFTNYDFQADMTYYISGPVYSYGTNTFEGGTVIKFATNGSIDINPGPPGINPAINCQAGPYRPVVFTAKDDNTVGESFGSGSPVGYYGNPMLFLAAVSGEFTGLRLAYAQTGVQLSGASSQFYDAQFINCQKVFNLGGASVYLGNALFAGNRTNFYYGSSASINAQNVTFNRSVWLATAPTNQWNNRLSLTNCLLADVTDLISGLLSSTNASDNGFYNTPLLGSPADSTTIYPFQSVGAGNYYLANDGAFRNVGTTNIDATLLADLATKTTYPPLVYSNATITSDLTLSPQAQRDTDAPDLGYHYDPLDYAFGGTEVDGNLTFTPGTAVGWFRTSSGWYHAGYGIYMADTKIATFQGTLTQPAWWVRANTVQEGGPGAPWQGGYGPGGLEGRASSITLSPEAHLYFARCSVLAGDGNHFRDDSGFIIIRANDSEFYSGGTGGYVLSLYLTNCLLDRTYIDQDQGGTGDAVIIRNCTHHGARLNLVPYATPILISVRDSAFDGTAITTANYGSNPSYVDYDYNAYTNATDPFAVGGTHDKSGVSFNWQSGPWGGYYQPTNSVLKDAGDVSADQVGLYHFTTTTNEVKEADSTVDIGYHYVAVDANANPIDTDGDEVPDYLEDANGNGTVDSGETDWQSATDLGLHVLITRPRDGGIIP